MRERFARHKQSLKTAPLSVFTHFICYHHINSHDVFILLLCQEPDLDLRTHKEQDWIKLLRTTIPRWLNNPLHG